MRRLSAACLIVLASALAGCKSKYIEATLENKSGESLSLIQVDYPSASFGTETLGPNASFHYRFKLIGSGPVKVSWVDARRGEHTSTGPQLNEGSQGRLGIVFAKSDSATFDAQVHP